MSADAPARAATGNPRPARHVGGRGLPWRWAVVPVLAAVAVSVCLPAGRHQWVVSLVRQPARMTYLAFTDPTGLPASVPAGGPVDVSFTIGNDEGRTMTYPYLLTEQDGATPQGGAAVRTLAAGSAIVADGRTATVTRRVRLTCRTTPCRVRVSLPGRPQLISFLVTPRPSGGPHA